MKSDVTQAVEELKRAFPAAGVTVQEDGAGGAYVFLEQVDLGAGFTPRSAWLGGHVTAQYPYADIYPIFMDAAVRKTNGLPFEVPITLNATFAGRPAIQVSRRNNQIHASPQSAVSKFVKVLDFLEKLQ